MNETACPAWETITLSLPISSGQENTMLPSKDASETSIFGHMAMKQTLFEEHPFFRYVETNPPMEWLLGYIPRMAFWIATFQDVLRVVEQRVGDPQLKSIASHIRAGDLGHDHWFLRDMRRLNLEVPTMADLFGPRHESTRMAAHALMSETYRASDDRLLVVLLLALESASYVFFTGMTNYLEVNNFPIDLLYFGRNHLDAEMAHGIVEAKMDMVVEEAIEASPLLRAEAIALIDRVFDAFTSMFAGFVPAETVDALSTRALDEQASAAPQVP